MARCEQKEWTMSNLSTLGLSLCRAASVASGHWTKDDKATLAMMLAGAPGPVRAPTMERLVRRGAIAYVSGQSYWTPYACHCGRVSYACVCGGIPHGGYPQ